MRTLTVDQFSQKELRNGEEYILICDIGHPLSFQERQDIIVQIENEQNRFKIVKEWTDNKGRYYVQIHVTRNLFVGLAVVLVLGTVFVVAAGISLSEALVAVSEVTEKSVPLALIGLAGVVVIVGYKWVMKKKS